MLTELQRLMSGLVEAESFALAGGAALIVHGLVVRATRDLDYFATASEAVGDVLPILEGTFRRDGLAVVRRRDAPGFVRLEVTDEAGQVIEVDLAYDARLHCRGAAGCQPAKQAFKVVCGRYGATALTVAGRKLAVRAEQPEGPHRG